MKKNAEKSCAKLKGSIPPDLASAIKFTESLNHLVESQKTEYFGKVSYENVKTMAKQRSQIINDALDMITRNYPGDLDEGDSLEGISNCIETFFLTDHCEEDEPNATTPSRPSMTKGVTSSMKRTPAKTPGKNKHHKHRTVGSGIPILDEVRNLFGNNKGESSSKVDSPLTSPVVPISKKTRRSVVIRAADEEMLQGSSRNLAVDDHGNAGDKTTKLTPAPTVVKWNTFAIDAFFSNNPYAVVVLVAVVLGVLRRAQFKAVTMDSDLAMLLSFAFFCFGYNWPRASSVIVEKAAAPAAPAVRRRTVAPAAQGPTARQLLRTSMMASPTTMDAAKSVREWDAIQEVEEEEPGIPSPMQTYPEGAELGEYFNCWSQPDNKEFHVRGPNYLSDRIKVTSGPFLFPTRGVDLFLTDDAPDNVGRYVVYLLCTVVLA